MPVKIKMFGRLALSLMIATSVAHHALGQQPSSTLRTPKYIVTNAGSGSRVLVWKDSDAHSRGTKLILNDVGKTHPEWITALLACIVPNGTPAMIDSVGLFTHDITIIGGSDAGCRGNIAYNDLKMIP